MKQKRILVFLFTMIMLFLSGCGSYQLRGPSDKDPKPGALAFCMYYREKRFIGEQNTWVYDINIVENVGNNRFANIPRMNRDDKVKEVLDVNGYCLIHTGLKPGVLYSIDRAKASYVEGRTQYTINIELEPETSAQKIAMYVEPGKIKFFGVIMLEAIVTEKGSLFVADKKAIQVVDGNEHLKDFLLGYIATYVYGKYEKSNKGAEANLLNSLLTTHKEGYWHDIAANRLKELGL